MNDILLERMGDVPNVVNLPHLVTHHSPDGFEFGYSGSGPADLALNILEYALQSTGFKGERVPCFQGKCFARAWDLHQEFKRQFIATMPHEGGVIKGEDVLKWLSEHE